MRNKNINNNLIVVFELWQLERIEKVENQDYYEGFEQRKILLYNQAHGNYVKPVKEGNQSKLYIF